MSYPGSKGQAGTFQRIIGQMPPHHTFIELFYGSGFITRMKRPAMINVAVDKLRNVLPSEPGCVIDEGFRGNVQSICDCGMNFLQRCVLDGPDNRPETLIYADPPYVLSARQGRFYYDHEMSDEQHQILLTLLDQLDCNVLLSGYPSKLYTDFLSDWRCISYRARTRGRTVTECLWANFPEPTELHDWRFAGKNFRERTSLKRLARRWLLKLDNMTPRKRGYVLNAIHERQT